MPRLVAFIALAASCAAPALGAPTDSAPGRLVVRFAPAAAREAARPDLAAGRSLERVESPAFARLASRFPGARFEPLFPGERPRATGRDLSAFWLVRLPAGADLRDARATLAASTDVAAVEDDAWLPVEAIPNDSLWSESWHLSQASGRDIAAPSAWELTVGDSSAIIAIIDTGVLRAHPDLGGRAGEEGKLWSNHAEQDGTPGVDDDGNGYVDDTWGWDFVSLDSASLARAGEDWRDEDNDPDDFASHGTAVAGVAAALTDNAIGVAGVAWGARVMALRVGWSAPQAPGGMVDMAWAARAILYATRNGATVINCSFASVPFEFLGAALDEAREAGVSVVAAAGNNGAPDYIGERADALSVTATDANDAIPAFAELGDRVDLAAPGVGLPATTCRLGTGDSLSLRVPSYTTGATGTSFSAPLVSGAIALLQSLRRAQGLAPLHPMETMYRVRENTDDIHLAAGAATGYGTGRLDASRVLRSRRQSWVIALGVATVGPGVVLQRTPGPASVLYATADGRIMVASAAGDTATLARLPGVPFGGLAAADLFAGGGPGLFVATTNGWLAGFDPSGQPLPGWPVAIPAEGSPHEPALGDLDGDGAMEVVWGSTRGRVFAFRVEGTPAPGFPGTLAGASGEARVALGDLDSFLPGVELAVTTTDGSLAELSGAGARLPVTFPALAGVTAPSLGRRAGGAPVIVVGVDHGAQVFHADGSLVFSCIFDGLPIGAPAIEDLNGDGRLEAVIVTRARPLMNVVSWEDRLVLTTVLTEGPAGGAIAGALQPGVLPLAMYPVANAYDELPMAAMSYFGKPAGRFPQPGLSGGAPTLTDWDGDGATEVLVGARRDGLLGVLDAGPGTWRAGGGRWPELGANAARTSNLAYAPALSAISDDPPLAVTDLRLGEVTTTGVRLDWTAPALSSGTGRVAGYDLRHAEVVLDAASFLAEGVPAPGPTRPAAPGAPESAVVSALSEGVTHHFAIRSRAPGGAWSAISPEVQATTPAIPPSIPRALGIVATRDSALDLRWLAAGDDDSVGVPSRYELRALSGAVDSAAFELSPRALDVTAQAAFGLEERATFPGLARGTAWAVAARTVDRAGRRSPWSEVVRSDAVAPAGIAPLAIEATSDASVTLSWQASGDDSLAGTPARYEVRAAQFALDASSFERATLRLEVAPAVAAGGRERAELAGLARGEHWWIAARALDEADNGSPLSNVVETDAVPPAQVRGLALDSLVDGRLALHWEASGDDGRVGRPLRYALAARTGPLGGGSTTPVEFLFEVAATTDAGGIEYARIEGLPPGRDFTLVVLAEDEAGLRSPPSDILSTDAVPPSAPSDFAVEAVSEAGVTLRWGASGDDGLSGRASGYQLRAANNPFGEAAFDLAPVAFDVAAQAAAGDTERFTMPGLAHALAWWIAVRAVDDAGNTSAMPSPIRLESVAPAPLATFRLLRRGPAGATFALRPGGDTAWPAIRLHLALVPAPERGVPQFADATYRRVIAASRDTGEQVIEADQLPPGQEFLAAIRAENAFGDLSPFSQAVHVPAGSLGALLEPVIRVLGPPSPAPVRFAWEVPPFRVANAWWLQVVDIGGRHVRNLRLAGGGKGLAEWDGRDQDGLAMPPGLYWVRLTMGVHFATARIVLLR